MVIMEIGKFLRTSTSEPVMNLYGGGLIMGNTNVDKMVAAYQWMKYIANTENSAVWSTESGYGFVRTSSADHHFNC